MRYLTVLAESLSSALGHDYDLFDLPGLTQAGVFRCHITGPSGRFAAFADSYHEPGFDPCLFVLARRGDPAVAALARRHLNEVAECRYWGGAARALFGTMAMATSPNSPASVPQLRGCDCSFQLERNRCLAGRQRRRRTSAPCAC